MKKIYILIGNFGSGKTELSLNIALNSAKQGKKTELIDLDMINTYFRLSERKTLIDTAEIRLVSPNFVSTGVETLSLPASISSAFHSDWDVVVFDVGGDGAGATALGRYFSDFQKLMPNQLEVLNIINIRRPMSGTAEKIISLMGELESRSRLKITGLVNNTNLAAETGEDELLDGYHILKAVSEKTGVPVKYTSGTRPFLDRFLSKIDKIDPAEKNPFSFIGEPMEIVTYMHRDWQRFTSEGI